MNHKIHQSLDKWVINKYLENFTQELHIYLLFSTQLLSLKVHPMF